jgi:hypothetical protein
MSWTLGRWSMPEVRLTCSNFLSLNNDVGMSVTSRSQSFLFCLHSAEHLGFGGKCILPRCFDVVEARGQLFQPFRSTKISPILVT